MPAHSKNTGCTTQEKKAGKVDSAQVFRCQEEGQGAEMGHKLIAYHRKHNDPEYQDHLVFPEVQQKKLYRQEAIDMMQVPGQIKFYVKLLNFE